MGSVPSAMRAVAAGVGETSAIHTFSSESGGSGSDSRYVTVALTLSPPVPTVCTCGPPHPDSTTAADTMNRDHRHVRMKSPLGSPALQAQAQPDADETRGSGQCRERADEVFLVEHVLCGQEGVHHGAERSGDTQ